MGHGEEREAVAKVRDVGVSGVRDKSEVRPETG